jgi:hypothetical protein
MEMVFEAGREKLSAPSKEDLDFATCHKPFVFLGFMAGTTGLEPATSAVTGQRSNQLSYVPRLFFNNLVIRHIESSGSQLSLFSIIALLWTQFRASVDTKVDTKTTTATTRSSLPEETVLVSTFPGHRARDSFPV